MPELPEVETIRRDLEGEIVGRKINRLEIEGIRTVRRHDPQLLIQSTIGAKVSCLRRHGKFLMIDLNRDVTIGVHLRMSGQLIWVASDKEAVPKHTHARFHFTNKQELRFVDPRTFGELWLTDHNTPEISHLGPDALNDITSFEVFAGCLKGRKSAIKTVLLNQNAIAGLGNIYTDEILWRSKVRFDKPTHELTDSSIERLYRAMREVIDGAVKARGSTLIDAQYVDMYGNAGAAQKSHEVYARHDQPCSRCGTLIRRVKFNGRSAHFCPKCQK